MKNGIHPQVNPVIFVDVSTGDKVFTTSTATSKETEVVDGVTYFVIRTDITAFSHPFFTGKVGYADRQGNIEKFNKRKLAAKTSLKAKGTAAKEDPRSYKDILREQQRALSSKKPTDTTAPAVTA